MSLNFQRNPADANRKLPVGIPMLDRGHEIWVGFFTWENVPGWRWRVKTSKSKYRSAAAFDLTKYTLLMPLLEAVPDDQHAGAIVKGTRPSRYARPCMRTGSARSPGRPEYPMTSGTWTRAPAARAAKRGADGEGERGKNDRSEPPSGSVVVWSESHAFKSTRRLVRSRGIERIPNIQLKSLIILR